MKSLILSILDCNVSYVIESILDYDTISTMRSTIRSIAVWNIAGVDIQSNVHYTTCMFKNNIEENL